MFHDETKLSLLNSITHKNVDEEILSRIDQFGKEEPEGLLAKLDSFTDYTSFFSSGLTLLANIIS